MHQLRFQLQYNGSNWIKLVTIKILEPNTGGVKDGTDNRPATLLPVGTVLLLWLPNNAYQFCRAEECFYPQPLWLAVPQWASEVRPAWQSLPSEGWTSSACSWHRGGKSEQEHWERDARRWKAVHCHWKCEDTLHQFVPSFDIPHSRKILRRIKFGGWRLGLKPPN